MPSAFAVVPFAKFQYKFKYSKKCPLPMQTNVPLQEINPGPTNTACECVWNKPSKDFLLFYLCSSVHSHCPRGWILNFERRKTNLIIKCISLRKGYSFQRMLKPISKAFISMIGHILFISRGKHNSWTFHNQYSTTTVSVTQGGGGETVICEGARWLEVKGRANILGAQLVVVKCLWHLDG